MVGPLLDLRFADGILVFATASQQATYLLDELVVALADVGLIFERRQKEIANDKTYPPKTNYDSQGSKRGCGSPKWMPQMARMHFVREQQRRSQTGS